ncbi:long-chain fatty acid--CoA ligase [Thiospirochaeta perfilievii]|uniref:Long-chain fatty acid--CoA ligase n=1 Tax=Thiospirochaeta perfilievii TaxID=252967 RepID=A0A5C1Q773_9SPIO|nr:AMP-binding protein [Thiospirochaeta perfilievii]QEN03865.1 long-chain fatty acid--CoA ligase [Thiospirochaeta perfilievii]
MYSPWKKLDKYKGDKIAGEWPTIPEMFDITTDEFPNNRAFTIFNPNEFTLTYKESNVIINKISRYLSFKGIKKGDNVALAGKNSPEWALAYLGIVNMGAVVVPIDYALSNNEIVELIKLSDSKLMFSEVDKYQFIKDNSVDLLGYISLNSGSENYILDLDDVDNSFEKPVESDIAAILYTSGTTGVSKGVMLTHKNFSSDVFLAQSNLKIYSTDVFYALLPIHHSYTMTSVFFEAIYVGAEVIFGKQLVFAKILEDFNKGKVTMFLGVPMLFNKILNGLLNGVKKKSIVLYGVIRFLMSISGFIKKSFKVNPGKKMFNFLLKKASLQNIRICISGGGPLAPSTFKHFNQLGIDFVQGYGLTEAAPMLALNPKEHYKVDSVGKIISNVDVKIINKDAEGIGDIVAKGPNIMLGYYKNEEATKNAFTSDGYLKTGDVGYLDSDNYLYLTGRKSSLIVTEGGKNVYPEELEDAFQLYNEIEQVLVKGYLKDSRYLSEGIEVIFYPTTEFCEGKTEDEIKSFFSSIVKDVNKTLTSYKHIDRLYIAKEALPMTTTKKLEGMLLIRNLKT